MGKCTTLGLHCCHRNSRLGVHAIILASGGGRGERASRLMKAPALCHGGCHVPSDLSRCMLARLTGQSAGGLLCYALQCFLVLCFVFCFVLCFVVFTFCVALCCLVLCCVVLCCVVLCCVVLCCVVLCCVVLHCVVLCCVVLCCVECLWHAMDAEPTVLVTICHLSRSGPSFLLHCPCPKSLFLNTTQHNTTQHNTTQHNTTQK